MNRQTQKGFTIIEVMLFLAVTGALTAGILVGSGVAIGQQRYRDSVNSFKGHVQEQYNQVTNVINGDPSNPVCSGDGESVVFNQGEGATQARGTSDCLILGRFMLVEPTQATVYSVVGQPSSSSANVDGGDSAVLNTYQLSLYVPEASVAEVREIAWGARIVDTNPEESEGMTTSVMIVRSPLSGSILTYIADGDQTSSIKGMVSDSNMVQKDFCVDSDGAVGVRSRMAVRINARASTQSAVEIPLEESKACG